MPTQQLIKPIIINQYLILKPKPVINYHNASGIKKLGEMPFSVKNIFFNIMEALQFFEFYFLFIKIGNI